MGIPVMYPDGDFFGCGERNQVLSLHIDALTSKGKMFRTVLSQILAVLQRILCNVIKTLLSTL